MSIKPLRDYVLLRKEETGKETKTDSGIILTNPKKDREELFEGTIVSVGAGRLLNNGEVLTPPVKAEDNVLFKQYAGYKVEDELWIIHSNDIIAVL